MTWRMAASLDVLLNEVNAAAPHRSKASDGGIGDAAHASRDSDHNPWVKDAKGVGVVRARDFTHDPTHGLDCNALADHLENLLGKHPALGSGAYIIWNGRIISTARRAEGWRRYTGSNPHTKHLHLSVATSGYDAATAYGWPPKRKVVRNPLKLQLRLAAEAADRGDLKALRKHLLRAIRVAALLGKPRLVERLWRIRREHTRGVNLAKVTPKPGLADTLWALRKKHTR